MLLYSFQVPVHLNGLKSHKGQSQKLLSALLQKTM